MKRSFSVLLALGLLAFLISGCVAQGTPAVGRVDIQESGDHGEATEAPGEAHSEATEVATEAPTEAPGEAPALTPTMTVAIAPTETATEAATEAPTEAATLAPTLAATLAATGEASSAATSEATTEATIEVTDGATGEATAAATEASATPVASAGLTQVTLFMGYIPNVQFAPIYYALDRGYFREAGIDLKLENGFDETDGLTRIGTGALQFGLISGEQVLLARAQGAPVVYVYRWYQSFPVGIVSPAESGITEPAQLRGRTVSVPVKAGASYVGLRALLNANGLQESDLTEVREIGYDTAPAVCDKQVEAAVVYIANEPAQIANRCFAVNVIQVSEFANLVSNGLVTNEKTIQEQPDLVRRMVEAFNRGLADTIAYPDLAFTASRRYVQGLELDDPVQKQVLTESIKLWKAERLGLNDPAAWQLTADTLTQMGLIREPLDVSQAFRNDFLP